MVKKREGYRPFAPSVLEDDAHEFFDLPEGTREFPFMNFVVRVRDSKRALLGAITHIDGTARLQTVSRKTNPAYWEVINAFKKRTGIPILLNTSFNNNAEPIVDSVADAIATFLTTELDGLVVGPYLVKKRTRNAGTLDCARGFTAALCIALSSPRSHSAGSSGNGVRNSHRRLQL